MLALTAKGQRTVWPIVKELAADGDIGQVWTVSRPLIDRALRRLEHFDFIESLGAEPSTDGPARTLLGTARASRMAVHRWLSVPSSHVRDLRTRLLFQLKFLDRSGRDLLPPLSFGFP